MSTDEADADADARALASTLRLRILRLCLDEPMTNRELAERLDRNPATLLHHVRTLVDRGFLTAQPVRRGARGAREVPYLATGKSWRAPGLEGSTRILIDTFLEEVALVDPSDVIATRLGLRLDPAGYVELGERLSAVFEEFAARPPTPGGTPYSLFFALHEDVLRWSAPSATASTESIDGAPLRPSAPGATAASTESIDEAVGGVST